MKVKVKCWKLGVAFFATGPGLGLIMYILTTLEFPKHNHDFHKIMAANTNVGAQYITLISPIRKSSGVIACTSPTIRVNLN